MKMKIESMLYNIYFLRLLAQILERKRKEK